MIATILLPSRSRLPMLQQAIRSILSTAYGRDFQIIVRLDDDDKDTLVNVVSLLQSPCVKVVTRPRGGGWEDLDNGKLLMSLWPFVTGTWFAIAQDDIVLSGQGWDAKLSQIPTVGYWACPEYHKLNQSVYPEDPRCCLPFVPRDALDFEHVPIKSFDDGVVKALIAKGWRPAFLPGITVAHNWGGIQARPK